MMRALIASILVVSCHARSFPAHAGGYLVSDGKYWFDYSVDRVRNVLTVELQAKTSGWVGWGVSPTGSMTGADIVIGWVGSDGIGHLSDRHGPETGNGFPRIDEQQDVNLLDWELSEGITYLRFERSIKSCDGKDLSIRNGTSKVIWSHSSEKVVGDVMRKHEERGMALVKFFLDEKERNEMIGIGGPTDVEDSWDLIQHNVPLGAAGGDTLYFCTGHRFNVSNTKFHIVSGEAVFDGALAQNVHHILIYQCPYLSDEELAWSGDCYGGQAPARMSACLANPIVYGWAIGGGIWNAPDVAGVPLGGETLQYAVLEIHYDNAAMNPNVMIPRAGAQLRYTSRLRQHDMGILMTGAAVDGFLSIPPMISEHYSSGVCSNECLKRYIPSEGINVVGTILHTHLLGYGIESQWRRNGEPIGVFTADYTYDSNFQTIDNMRNTKLYPTDELSLTCYYNSTMKRRQRVTTGGLGTQDEMCLLFIFYYPRLPLISCQSTYGKDAFLQLESMGTFASINQSVLDTVKQYLEAPPNIFSQVFRYLVTEQTFNHALYNANMKKISDKSDNRVLITQCGVQFLNRSEPLDEQPGFRLISTDPEPFRGYLSKQPSQFYEEFQKAYESIPCVRTTAMRHTRAGCNTSRVRAYCPAELTCAVLPCANADGVCADTNLFECDKCGCTPRVLAVAPSATATSGPGSMGSPVFSGGELAAAIAVPTSIVLLLAIGIAAYCYAKSRTGSKTTPGPLVPASTPQNRRTRSRQRRQNF